MYEGENRKRGAMLSFFVKPLPTLAEVSAGKDTSAAKQKTDSAWVKIFDEQNKQIRSFKVKADSGFNRIYWGFETKGTRQPGSPKPNAPEPFGGMQVFPGTYKVVITLDKESDSTNVIVKADPRIEVKKEVYDAKKKMAERLQQSTDKLTLAVDRLTDAEETITKIEASLKNTEGKEADSLRKASDEIKKEIKKIRETIFGRTSEKQGIVRFADRTTSTALQTARMEIMSKLAAPTAQTERLVSEAETGVNHSLQKITEFFDGKWKDYRKLAEAAPIKLFKDYK
jgi:hypothetical protein